jgi:glycosyltransferase involved in cell wall biosynthesis
MNMPLEISVIIPTHNRWPSLSRTLRALSHQTVNYESFEVIVVADGCKDDTVARVRSFFPPYQLTLIEQPNSGPAVSRNSGAKNAHAPVLLFIDDDVEPEPQLVAAHMKAQKKHPGNIIIGFTPFEDDLEENDYINIFLKEWWDALFFEMSKKTHRFKYKDLITANVSISKTIFNEVGGFDPAFSLLTMEDFELGYRLLQKNIRFRFVREAAGKHNAKRSEKAFFKRMLNQGRTEVLFLQRHPEAVRDLGLGYPYGLRNKIRWCNAHFNNFLSSVLLVPLNLAKLCRRRWLYFYIKDRMILFNYWTGVKIELGSFKNAIQFIEDAWKVVPVYQEIEIDLKNENVQLPDILTRHLPDAVTLRFGDLDICRIGPDCGVEPLRPFDVYQALYKNIKWKDFLLFIYLMRSLHQNSMYGTIEELGDQAFFSYLNFDE